jgi:DNA-binding XRE family transcriptional regulator
MKWTKLKLQLLKDNDSGKRLRWVRNILGYTQKEVSTTLEVPRYHDMENGERTKYWETILLVALFYNKQWQNEFKDTYPTYKGEQVKQISPYWIMFGRELTAFAQS